MTFHRCPEPGCEMPTEVLERFVLSSTDGPTEHVATLCLDRHRFRMPAEQLPAAG